MSDKVTILGLIVLAALVLLGMTSWTNDTNNALASCLEKFNAGSRQCIVVERANVLALRCGRVYPPEVEKKCAR